MLIVIVLEHLQLLTLVKESLCVLVLKTFGKVVDVLPLHPCLGEFLKFGVWRVKLESLHCLSLSEQRLLFVSSSEWRPVAVSRAAIGVLYRPPVTMRRPELWTLVRLEVLRLVAVIIIIIIIIITVFVWR